MDLLNRFLVVKVAVIVLVAVMCGFAVSALLNADRQLKTMQRLHGQGAEALAEALATGVRHTMLRGDGLAVSEFVKEAKKRISLAEIHVYSPDGEEVFGERAEAPTPEQIPVHVRDPLTTARPYTGQGLHAYPIANETRCKSCHTEGKLRAVLTLGTEKASVPVDATDPSLDALSQIARSGFVQIMTGRKDEDLEAYFEALVHATPGLEGVAVLDNTGEPYFTGGSVPLPPEVAARAVQPGDPFTVRREDGLTRLVPLPSAPRCKGCHEEDETMRGALAVRFDPEALAGHETVRHAVTTSLQHVMLAGLGRLIVAFLDEVGTSGLVSAMTVHDAEGRLYHDAFGQPSAPPLVAEALSTGNPAVHMGVDGESFEFVTPLHNEPRCQSCHGTDKPLRGAISVSLDTSADILEFQARRQESLALSGLTVLMVILLLYLGLRWTVLRPVKLIGDVADKVGAGDLDVTVELDRVDEMGRLAHQINQMTRGLRQRLTLAKFVSDETFRTVEQLDMIGRVGTRRRVTVLFSDIRGFTAFSETREPEQVVEMLNAYLQVQAEAVLARGGDIDKFVGDELMARFDGPGQEQRAIEAGVDIIEAVERLNLERGSEADQVAVGVGVNSGDVIVGAMGAEQRMDFTIIGDAVNLGARLCSAAAPGQVIVSKATADASGVIERVAFESLDPIQVKGKAQPISIVLAQRDGTPEA